MAGYFPMFYNMENKTVLIIGEGKKATEKAEKLLPFKPEIIFVTDKTEDFKKLFLEISPSVVIVADETLTDVNGLYEFCAEKNIPLNTVDNRDLSTFIFPSMICTESLTVAVSTSGKSPAAAVKIRKDIESIIPDSIDEILDWLGSLRPVLKSRSDIDKKNLAAIYKSLADEAFEKNRPLTENEIEDTLKLNNEF